MKQIKLRRDRASSSQCDRCKGPLKQKVRKGPDGSEKIRYIPFITETNERICPKCITCDCCDSLKEATIGRGITVPGHFADGQKLRDGRGPFSKWFCDNDDCQLKMKDDKVYLQSLQRRKEDELRSNNFDYGDTFAKPQILNRLIAEMMHPEFYGLQPDEDVVSTSTAMMRFFFFFKTTIDGQQTFIVTPSMVKYVEGPSQDIFVEFAANTRRREPSSYKHVVAEIVQLQNFVRRSKDKPTEELKNKCLPMNCSLYYLSRRVMNEKSIDGLEEVMLALLRHWWALGFYPPNRIDYFDIPNKWLKQTLQDYLARAALIDRDQHDLIALAFNDDQLECVVCMGDFQQLVRTDCGHRVTCQACSIKLSHCPICIRRIEHRLVIAYQ